MHLPSRCRITIVVESRNGHLDALTGRVDQAQPADLVPIASGVEEPHVMAHSLFRHYLVHRGHESVTGADVRQ